MLAIFPILALLCASSWWLILGKPKYIPKKSARKDSKKISIIIPARNEEKNIVQLLESINKQKSSLPHPPEVILVDDQSEDQTANIAASLGAKVISSQTLPDGWKGKPWACLQGAKSASNSHLLFLDADTWLEESALVKLSTLAARADTVISICPHHVTRHHYEQLSAFFNVMMTAGSNNFSRPPQSETLLFGQALLISKDIYQSIGGHEPVKDKVLENVHLSEIIRNRGIQIDNYLGRGVISMRMFPDGLRQLWLSWKKGFVTGAAAVPKYALCWSSVWITGAMFTIVSLIVASCGYGSQLFSTLSLISYLIYVIQCILSFSMIGRFHRSSPWLFPILLIFYQCLFFTAIIHTRRGIKTQWKGRDVH